MAGYFVAFCYNELIQNATKIIFSGYSGNRSKCPGDSLFVFY